MMIRHCSEEELQLLSAENQSAAPEMMQHLESCSSCREQLAAYRLVASGVKNLPVPAFDFDLAGAILQQLQPAAPVVVRNNYYQYIPGFLVVAIVAATLYIFRQNFANLSGGISSLFLVISIISCTGILVYKAVKLYQLYKLQIKKLNFSE